MPSIARTVRASWLSLLLAAVATAAVCLPVAPALAHNVLRSSDPADGASVESVEALTLTFDDAVLTVGAAVQVTGPDGVMELEDPRVDGQQVVQPLGADVAAGDYSVLWRVTSADGHPIDGELAFTVAGVPPAAPTTGTTQPSVEPTDEPSAEPGPSPGETETSADEGDASAPVPPADAGSSLPVWVLPLGALALAGTALAFWLTARRRTELVGDDAG